MKWNVTRYSEWKVPFYECPICGGEIKEPLRHLAALYDTKHVEAYKKATKRPKVDEWFTRSQAAKKSP